MAKVRHAWQNPRVKPDHVPVIQNVLNIVQEMKAFVYRMGIEENPQYLDMAEKVSDWVSRLDEQSLILCLKGEKNAGTKRLQESRGKGAESVEGEEEVDEEQNKEKEE